MVRTYVHKKKIVIEDEIKLRRAVKEALLTNKKLLAIARKYSLKSATLNYHVTKAKMLAQSPDKNVKLYLQRVFTPSQELVLSRQIILHCKLNYGITELSLRSLAYECAKRIGRKVPRNWEKEKLAGKDWYFNFLKRIQNLSGEEIKHDVVDFKKGIDTFCSSYEAALETIESNPSRIFCFSDVGIILHSLSKKDNKITHSGLHLSLCLMCNANGISIPPVFVFPLKSVDASIMEGAPDESIGLNGDSEATITEDHFVQVINHISEYTQTSAENPILLLLDTKKKYITQVIRSFCEKNGVILVSVPTQWPKHLQPVESALIRPFEELFVIKKKSVASVKSNFLGNFVKLISDSYSEVLQLKKLQRSFKQSHIWPFCKESINDASFVKKCFEMEKMEPEWLNHADADNYILIKRACFKDKKNKQFDRNEVDLSKLDVSFM